MNNNVSKMFYRDICIKDFSSGDIFYVYYSAKCHCNFFTVIAAVKMFKAFKMFKKNSKMNSKAVVPFNHFL